MNILVIGSGGREHALAWKLSQSPRCGKLYCAPGNAGTAGIAENADIPPDDVGGLADFAERREIGLTVVGPDNALADGLVDTFEARGLRAFGPPQAGARLESSKVFAKEFMRRHGIPTAASAEFDDFEKAAEFIRSSKYRLVVKADGLALGKGVLICESKEEAEEAARSILVEGRFGEAGASILVEEFLEGVECSIHAVFDANGYLILPPAQDHKRALDNDRGLNTGGMGTFSPPPAVDDEMMREIERIILKPFFNGVREDGIPFRGMLFPGLMLTEEGPRVLEFNCRFGDPETQVLLPRLKSDLVDLLEAAMDDRVGKFQAEWDTRSAVCVVMASGGYPESYEKGVPVEGLETLKNAPDVAVFHAGTAWRDNAIVTSGGRVLGVTAMDDDLLSAMNKAYRAVESIHFKNAHYRRDIARKGIA